MDTQDGFVGYAPDGSPRYLQEMGKAERLQREAQAQWDGSVKVWNARQEAL